MANLSAKVQITFVLTLLGFGYGQITTCKQVRLSKDNNLVVYDYHDFSSTTRKPLALSPLYAGIVRKVMDITPTGFTYAKPYTSGSTKVFLKVRFYKNEFESTLAAEELIATKSLQGLKNIVKMEDCFEYSDRLVFVLEHIEITLQHAIADSTFTVKQRLSVAKKILKIFIKLQNVGFLHGDLKSANLMCRKADCKEIVLIDFEQSSKGKPVIAGGTLEYTPPERAYYQLNYQTYEAENWALALIILELINEKVANFFFHCRMKRNVVMLEDFVLAQQNFDLIFGHLPIKMQKSLRKWVSFFPGNRATPRQMYKDVVEYGEALFTPSCAKSI